MRLTKNFRKEEFACRDGCGFDKISLTFVKALQELRDLIGKPIHVASGCRCKNHNKVCGGVSNSQHLEDIDGEAKAADVSTKLLTPGELADIAEKRIPEFENGGIGRYPGFVHLDIGPKRRW